MSKMTKPKGEAPIYASYLCIHCKFRDGGHCIAINGKPDPHCPACPIENPKTPNY